MGQLLQVGELLLLVLLAILQLGRWSKKTEEGPAAAFRVAREAKAKADETAIELRKHKRAHQEYLERCFADIDRVYARKREVELQFKNVTDKLENDYERITELEEKCARYRGA